MFHGGAAMSQEAYIVVRSGDGGRTWRLVASEPYFGVHAPFEFDSYSGPWTISGAQKAYFTGACPACNSGTVSLWVTLDGGATFRKYALPTIAGYRVIAIRVRGPDVTVTAKPVIHVGAAEKTVTVVVR